MSPTFRIKAELDSIDFVQYTPLLQSLSILGLIKRSISLQSLQELKFLDALNFGDYLEITKKQLSVINSLTNLKELEVKKMDASSLNPNFQYEKVIHILQTDKRGVFAWQISEFGISVSEKADEMLGFFVDI